MIVGILGKPNVGKSTFFVAATLKSVPIADFPFTTIKPNVGMAYLRTKCVHEEMGVVDKPKNSVCANGVRLIPVNWPGAVSSERPASRTGLASISMSGTRAAS